MDTHIRSCPNNEAMEKIKGPRVRFAPSPTGFLHVGNMRIAFLNWLFSKAEGGEFILRIDDTDAGRNTDVYAQALIEDLLALGVTFQGPIYQSKRLPLYEKAIDFLKTIGRVYACYETPEELKAMREAQHQKGKPPRYNRAGLVLTQDQRSAFESQGRRPHWRFQLSDQPVSWMDLVAGPMRFESGHFSDPVVMREDGAVTYTLASVVDDLALGITHIFRGADHIANTAVQIDILRTYLENGGSGAFIENNKAIAKEKSSEGSHKASLERGGQRGHRDDEDDVGGFLNLASHVKQEGEILDEMPRFAHFPLLRGSRGEVLSKRLDSLRVRSLLKEGLHPLALWTTLEALGTSRAPSLIMQAEELVKEFTLMAYGRASPAFDVQKLWQNHWVLLRKLAWPQVCAFFENFEDCETKDERFEIKGERQEKFEKQDNAIMKSADREEGGLTHPKDARASLVRDLDQNENPVRRVMTSPIIKNQKIWEVFKDVTDSYEDLQGWTKILAADWSLPPEQVFSDSDVDFFKQACQVFEKRGEKESPQDCTLIQNVNENNKKDDMEKDLSGVQDMRQRFFKTLLKELGETSGRRGKALMRPLRIALTGREDGPALPDFMENLGMSLVVKRFQGAALRVGPL